MIYLNVYYKVSNPYHSGELIGGFNLSCSVDGKEWGRSPWTCSQS